MAIHTALGITVLRIALLTVRRFNEHKCSEKASALTYYSLLSIVPVFAMAFGVAKGFGFDKVLENQIIEKFAGQEEIMSYVIDFSRTMLENTKGGLLAGIGVAFLFYTVVRVFGNIEASFNDIWEFPKGRTIVRKFSDYLSLMLLSPILLIASSSATVYITTQITQISQNVALVGYFNPLISFFLKLVPYFLIWVLLTLIYYIMPHGKVKLLSALIAGIIAGSLFTVTQWAYINFQVGVAKYNAIYGSFAALPLFLFWLQISWLIVLIGAEIASAHQNMRKWDYAHDSANLSDNNEKLIALNIMNLILKSFHRGDTPHSADDISETLSIPIRVVRQVLDRLTKSAQLVEISSGDDMEDFVYLPARDSDTYSIASIIIALESFGSDTIPIAESDTVRDFSEILQRFHESFKNSPQNILIREI